MESTLYWRNDYLYMKYNLGKGDLPVDQDHGSSLPIYLWSVHLSIDFSEHPSIDSLKWRRCSMRPLSRSWANVNGSH